MVWSVFPMLLNKRLFVWHVHDLDEFSKYCQTNSSLFAEVLKIFQTIYMSNKL